MDSSNSDTSAPHTPSSVDLNVVVLGAVDVGKSAIISQLVKQKFPRQASCTTELEKTLTVIKHGKKSVTLQITDTPGGYCFNARRKIAIESGDAFVLVFALDDEMSFLNAAMLREEILRFGSKKAPVILVGNKADVPSGSHVTSNEAVRQFAWKEWRMKYTEVSAKENRNVSQILSALSAIHQKKKSIFHSLRKLFLK